MSTSRQCSGSQAAKIAYLSAAYPAITHTFILREVLALRALGQPISTFAINREDDFILTDDDRAERASTVYLKSLGIVTTFRIISSEVLHRPRAVWSTLRAAWRGVGLDLGRMIKRTMQVGEALLLARMCRDEGISHIHAHMGQAPANIAWFASHFANAAKPVTPSTWSVTIHGPQDCLNEPKALLARKIESAEFVVAVSDYTKAQLLWQTPAATWPKMHTVRCGIDPGPQPTWLQPTHRGPFRVLVVARLSPEKGHGVMLQALAALRDRGLDVRLELVGPGDFEATFGAMADQLRVRELVTLTGGVAPLEVVERMKSSDVLCVPSFAEGLPVVLMEAAATGLAVVATGISGIPELIEHEVTGLLTIPARSDLLAEALERLIRDDELRLRLAHNARTRVEDLHNGLRNAAELVRLFDEVVHT